MSKCIAEAWPYGRTSWEKVGHSNWRKVGGFISQSVPDEISSWRRKVGADWSELDWRGSKGVGAQAVNVQEQHQENWKWNELVSEEGNYESGSFRRDAAGIKMRRRWNKNPQRKKGGVKKHRSDPEKNEKRC